MNQAQPSHLVIALTSPYRAEVGDLKNTGPEIKVVMCQADPVVTSTVPRPVRDVSGVAQVELFPVKQQNRFVSRTKRINLR